MWLILLLAGFAQAGNPLCPFQKSALRGILGPKLRPQAAEIETQVKDYEERFGACQRFTNESGASFLQFSQARVPVRFEPSSRGWKSLSFGAPQFPNDTREKIEKDAGLRGAAIFGSRGQREFLNHGGDQAQSVGELEYLLVLRDYRRALAKGSLKETDTVSLKPEDAVFSLGPLAHWPAGTPLTLESLAQLAFRSRDNVAGDLLLEATGRSGRFTYAEMMRLVEMPRAQADPLWKAGPPLPPSALPLQNPLEPVQRANGLATGWFATPRELCLAAASLGADPAFEGFARGTGQEDLDGAFPRTHAVLRLARGQVTGDFTCGLVILPGGGKADRWASDLLERSFALASSLPAGQASKK